MTQSLKNPSKSEGDNGRSGDIGPILWTRISDRKRRSQREKKSSEASISSNAAYILDHFFKLAAATLMIVHQSRPMSMTPLNQWHWLILGKSLKIQVENGPRDGRNWPVSLLGGHDWPNPVTSVLSEHSQESPRTTVENDPIIVKSQVSWGISQLP